MTKTKTFNGQLVFSPDKKNTSQDLLILIIALVVTSAINITLLYKAL